MTTLTHTKTRHSWRRTVRMAMSYGILILVTVLISLPVVWFVITSLKVDTEYGRALDREGYGIYVMTGLYVYHRYDRVHEWKGDEDGKR